VAAVVAVTAAAVDPSCLILANLGQTEATRPPPPYAAATALAESNDLILSSLTSLIFRAPTVIYNALNSLEKRRCRFRRFMVNNTVSLEFLLDRNTQVKSHVLGQWAA
jgi:hypothetical protein